jgi:polyisoprenyl-phosphate glycosyltransferase
MARPDSPAGELVSVVLPARNEAASLPAVVGEVLAALAGWRAEVIVVDDGSGDGTWEQVVRLHADHPEVRGLRLSRNFGQQAALMAGLGAARGSAVLTLDADGQHPPELIPALLEAWREGAAVVQAIRLDTAGAGFLKRWTSRLFYRLLSLLSGVEIEPGSSDFRLLSRPALEAVLASAGPRPFLRALVPWLGLETRKLPFTAPRRIGGRSSYGLRRMLRLSLDGVLGFSVVPLRLAIAVGAVVSLFSFLYLVYVVVVRLATGQAVPGWASTAGLLSLLGGIQLVTLGILGEYLGRVFVGSLGRPRFVVRERLGEPGEPDLV